jgi:hypothetical protein
VLQGEPVQVFQRIGQELIVRIKKSQELPTRRLDADIACRAGPLFCGIRRNVICGCSAA